MAYQQVHCSGVQFAVDWDVLERLCRSYWVSVYQLENANVVEMSQSKFYNPFSWAMPSTRNVEVPWEKVRGAAGIATIKDMVNYSSRAAKNLVDVAREMDYRVATTRTMKGRFRDLLRGVQSFNAGTLEDADKNYTGIIEAARFIRDTSADVVAIGSTIATGGAAAGLLGTSSALKGWGKFQDTDDLGAAVVYGGGSLFLGAFKVGGAKFSTGGEYVYIVVQGTLETATSLTAGDSFAKAVQKGAIKVASAGAAQALFSSNWVSTVFERIPIPFNVFSVTTRDGLNITQSDVANKLLEKVGKKLTEKGAKTGLNSALGVAAPTKGGSVALEAPLDDRILLQLSIVNLEKGIGRGW